jgi:hypothetical protein
MTTQAQKYHLSLAGEFFVAAELQRRGVAAAVTYGNAKSADVVAFSASGEKAVVVEVKCTSQLRWVVGVALPPASDKPWVFVYLPTDQTQAPRYYLLTQLELRSILEPVDVEYRQKYKAKHGEEYGDRPGVHNLTCKQAEPFLNAWGKIIDQLN